MSALPYILYRTLVNIIKDLLRKPIVLTAYLLIAAFFIGTFLLSSSRQQQGMDARVGEDIVKAIFAGYTAFLFVVAFLASLGGTSFFRMADVNMLFTAPQKAGSILVYGFVKQLAANIMIMLFLALQYPNWKAIFGFRNGAGWILITAYLLMVAVTSLLGMILYANVSKKPHRASVVKRMIYLLIAAFLFPIALGIYRTGDILQSSLVWLSDDRLRFIPLIGWFREMLLGSLTGLTPAVWQYGMLTIITILASFAYLYRMDTGFYEHVLSGSQLRETMVENVREGRSGAVSSNRKYRKIKAKFTMEGSLAVFQKQMLERRKTGIWLISNRSIVLLLGGLLAAVSIPVEGLQLLSGILGVSTYILLIMKLAGTWESELTKHYIYLIPAPAFGKMLSATLPEMIRLLIEGVLIFGIVGAVLRISPWTVVSIVAAYVTIGGVFTYSDLVVRRLFGTIHGKVLRIFFRLFLLILILSFVVIPAVVVISVTGSHTLGFLLATLINTVLSGIFMWMGTGLFSAPELP